jgi:glycosyltransferase involved in cell wall biosynthesis
MRQRIAAGIRERTQDVWPIFPGSERTPEGWMGWPDGKAFAVVLTHDVEGQAGLDNCRRLMELEQEMGFRSSFNFIPEGDYRVPAALRQELSQNGFEVGVHDLKHDGRLYRSRRAFSRNAAQINRYLQEWKAAGFRSGFMLHNLNWLHELDISYDMSTFDTDPFEPQPEGCHTIFPFWIARPRDGDFSPSYQNGSQGYVELPYTLPQDSTVYLLLGEETANIWLRKSVWVAQHGGMVLLNIHPDYIDFDEDRHTATKYPASRVREFLGFLRDRNDGNFWNACPAEVATWYKENYVYRSKSLIDAARRSEARGGICLPEQPLRSRRTAVLLYSYYPADPRPRRAAEAMVRAGAGVDLICLRKPGEKAREIVNGVNVLRLPIRKKRHSKLTYFSQYSSFFFACFGLLVARSLRRRYDLVHVHNMPDALVFSALIPKLLRAKVILDLHDPMPELMMSIYKLPTDYSLVRLLKTFEKLSIDFASVILTPNKAFRDLFISRGCPPCKIEIIMNAPEEDIFDPANYRSGDEPGRNDVRPFRLMYHGLIAERHGLDTALQALALLREKIPQLQFHIFGNRTTYMDYMDSLVEELGLGAQVRYHGYQPQIEIARAIAEVDLGIIPNKRNPFTELNMPTRIFEYLAMGKPAIVPNTRGVRDYFDENSAFFFEPGDPQSLASAVQRVVNEPDEVAALLANARSVYEQHRWQLQQSRFIGIVSNCFSNSMKDKL